MFKKLKNELETLKLDCLLVTSSSNIFYLTKYEGFSKEEKEAVILITKKNNYLLTDKRYLSELQYLRNFKLEEISAGNPLSKILTKISKENNLVTAGFETNNLTFSEYKKFRKVFKSFKPLEDPIENLRELKTKEEIGKIKKACKLSDMGFSYLLKQIKKDVTEEELAVKLEIFLKENGGGISFKPIIAFGKNSAVPHHLNSQAKLKKGDIVLIDIGAKVEGYCSDMTRTIFFGSPTLKFERIYQTVLNAQKLAIQQFNNSAINEIKASDVDKTARKYIIENGFPSIPHSLGHGIGIDVHESPSLSPKSKSRLENGMIFSIEPGIYLSGWGGVRIEDLFLLKGNSLEKITHSTSEIISL
ncbi:MAG: aminopeptidase P family protein [Patescibacteria group bacterium]|nr:aminopeptidase P family protein [Patescibacteria group bacterium]